MRRGLVWQTWISNLRKIVCAPIYFAPFVLLQVRQVRLRQIHLGQTTPSIVVDCNQPSFDRGRVLRLQILHRCPQIHQANVD